MQRITICASYSSHQRLQSVILVIISSNNMETALLSPVAMKRNAWQLIVTLAVILQVVIQQHPVVAAFEEGASPKPEPPVYPFLPQSQDLTIHELYSNMYHTTDEVDADNPFNRYRNITPEPDTAIIVKDEEDSGSGGYINANLVEGVSASTGGRADYIMSQAPPRNTIGSFWKMV